MFDLSNVVFIHRENAGAGVAEPFAFASVPPAADPIFEAIERLHAADERFVAASVRCDEAMLKRNASAKAKADALYAQARDEDRVQASAFVATVPLTLAGIRAGLAFAFKYDEDGSAVLRPFVEALLRSPVWTAAPVDPLVAAIERHKAVLAEIDGLPGEEDVPDQLAGKERAALFEIAALPCVDDEIFLEKLRYLAANQKLHFGRGWRVEKAEEIITALNLHLHDGFTE